MSLGGIIGGAIGFFVGGPSGAKWGYAIGSSLDQPAGQDIQGPRLNDLKVQTSTYGAPRPIVYGNARLAGNVIWAKDIREIKNTEDSGGKGGGGGTTTSYEYYGTFAVALCDNEVGGVRKIWADSVLIYDLGDTASLETIQASNLNSNGIRIYRGTETQSADSLIQADKGAANTQAYRGTTYIVFDNLALEKYGNRIPSISVEVVQVASIAPRLVADFATPVIPAAYSSASSLCMDNGSSEAYLAVGQWTSPFDPVFNAKIYKVRSNGSAEYLYNIDVAVEYSGSACQGTSDVPAAAWACRFPTINKIKVWMLGSSGVIGSVVINYSWHPYPFSANLGSVHILNNYLYGFSFDIGGTATVNIYRNSLNIGIDDELTGQLFIPEADLSVAAYGMAIDENYIYTLNTDDTIDLFGTDSGVYVRTISFTPSPVLVYSRTIGNDVIISLDNGIIYLSTLLGVHRIQNDVYSYLGTVATPGDGSNGGNLVKDGVIYTYRATEDRFKAYQLESLSTGAVVLSDIQADICERSGLDIADFDVTALTDSVDGYIITSPMSARAASEPLGRAYFYDSAEINNVLTFVKRGGSSVLTIPQDDLGVGDSIGGSELYLHTRRQDSELPSKVVIDYIDTNRSYETGSQIAQRINSPSENVNKQSVAIVMTGSYAKEVAYVLLYDAHVERDKFSLNINNNYIALNPTDIIQFTVGSKTRRVRITGISYGKSIELECVLENASVYVATSIAGESEDDAQTVGLKGATNLYLLDIPLLRNSDNDSGMYVAVSGYYSGWTGSTLYKSLDSGTSYSPTISALNQSVMGKADTVLATASATIFDRTNSVTVRITSGTLSSSTESLVIQGANYAILGSEVIQFVTATDNGDDTYTLSTLLRGRLGSDWATATHVVNENFSLLQELILERVGAIINTERHYKAATFGTALETADSYIKTNTGVSQMPLSPKYIAGTRDGSLNLAISWVRRSRYISPPLWNPPVFEETESYVIEILDGVGGSVVNSYTSSSELYEYTAAQQTTDFGSTQSTVYVKIYQVSATVGNGYGTEATL